MDLVPVSKVPTYIKMLLLLFLQPTDGGALFELASSQVNAGEARLM